MRVSSTQALAHNIVHHLFHGAVSIEAVEPLVGGVSARSVTRVRLQEDEDQQDLVLRIHGELKSDHLPAALEFQLLQSLHDFGLSVPKPLLFGPTGKHEEDTFIASSYPFLVMEMANGSSDIPPGQESHYITLMADTLARIHNVPASGFPSKLLPKRNNPLPELWQYYNENSFPKSASALRQLLNENYTSYDGFPCLLHGDFWPGNLLFRDEDDPVVLDWEDAATGDFWSDVATCRIEVRYKWGRSAMQAFTESYCAHRSVSLDEPRLCLWQVYVASAAVANMGSWGLDPALEDHMRAEATASVEEASQMMLRIHGESGNDV